MPDLWFLPLGLLVGTLGTLMGAGGGFILVPILIMMYPQLPAEQITAISMLCVACNAGSGTLAYLARRQVHLKTALIFTLASIPGAWLGASFTRVIDRSAFELFFATILLALGAFIYFRKPTTREAEALQSWKLTVRDYQLGFGISLVVGFFASSLGIGGGIVHVPLLTHALQMPLAMAAGTSQFILVITAIVATIEHSLHGDFTAAASFLPYLALGMLVGAQIGAFLARRISSALIMKALALTIVLVGIRIVWAHQQHPQVAAPETAVQKLSH